MKKVNKLRLMMENEEENSSLSSKSRQIQRNQKSFFLSFHCIKSGDKELTITSPLRQRAIFERCDRDAKIRRTQGDSVLGETQKKQMMGSEISKDEQFDNITMGEISTRINDNILDFKADHESSDDEIIDTPHHNHNGNLNNNINKVSPSKIINNSKLLLQTENTSNNEQQTNREQFLKMYAKATINSTQNLQQMLIARAEMKTYNQNDDEDGNDIEINQYGSITNNQSSQQLNLSSSSSSSYESSENQDDSDEDDEKEDLQQLKVSSSDIIKKDFRNRKKSSSDNYLQEQLKINNSCSSQINDVFSQQRKESQESYDDQVSSSPITQYCSPTFSQEDSECSISSNNVGTKSTNKFIKMHRILTEEAIVIDEKNSDLQKIDENADSDSGGEDDASICQPIHKRSCYEMSQRNKIKMNSSFNAKDISFELKRGSHEVPSSSIQQINQQLIKESELNNFRTSNFKKSTFKSQNDNQSEIYENEEAKQKNGDEQSQQIDLKQEPQRLLFPNKLNQDNENNSKEGTQCFIDFPKISSQIKQEGDIQSNSNKDDSSDYNILLNSDTKDNNIDTESDTNTNNRNCKIFSEQKLSINSQPNQEVFSSLSESPTNNKFLQISPDSSQNNLDFHLRQPLSSVGGRMRFSEKRRSMNLKVYVEQGKQKSGRLSEINIPKNIQLDPDESNMTGNFALMSQEVIVVEEIDKLTGNKIHKERENIQQNEVKQQEKKDNSNQQSAFQQKGESELLSFQQSRQQRIRLPMKHQSMISFKPQYQQAQQEYNLQSQEKQIKSLQEVNYVLQIKSDLPFLKVSADDTSNFYLKSTVNCLNNTNFNENNTTMNNESNSPQSDASSCPSKKKHKVINQTKDLNGNSDNNQDKIKQKMIYKQDQNKKLKFNQDYLTFLAFRPAYWEYFGISMIRDSLKRMQSLNQQSKIKLKILFNNIGNSNSMYRITALKQEYKNNTSNIHIYSETTAAHLFFSSNRIQNGSTIFKCEPPIGPKENKEFLINASKLNMIDIVSSYHFPVIPQFKLIEDGDFRKAFSGICTAGCTLQATWTSMYLSYKNLQKNQLNPKTEIDEELKKTQALLKYVVTMLSFKPAKLLNISHLKGSICKKKYADFVIWDPFAPAQRVKISSNYKFKQVHIFDKKKLFGQVSFTILRGKIIYSQTQSQNSIPHNGKLLTKQGVI